MGHHLPNQIRNIKYKQQDLMCSNMKKQVESALKLSNAEQYFQSKQQNVKVSRLMKGNKRFINDNGKLRREKTTSPSGIVP